jgi:hypothetical protein
VETATTPAVSATEDAPASSQIRSEDFELVLLGTRRFTICLLYQFDTYSPNFWRFAHQGILPKSALLTELFSLFLRFPHLYPCSNFGA